MDTYHLGLRIDKYLNEKIEAIQAKYNLPKKSQAVRKALEILSESTPTALEKRDLQGIEDKLEHMRKEIERLEFIIMQGAKK